MKFYVYHADFNFQLFETIIWFVFFVLSSVDAREHKLKKCYVD